MDKIHLVQEMTPITKLNFRVNSTNIFMKREDLIGFAFGGNKVRLFEYIAADVKANDSEKIITFGSVHSNHIRVAAIIANHLGIACDLIILYDGNETDCLQNGIPNLHLIKPCSKIKTVFCKTEEATEFIDDYLKEQSKLGVKYYWIPGGGHLPIAVNGYKDVAKEIQSQLTAINIEAVFLPCGTGTTMAGLIAGFQKTIPVYGVTVARPVERCKNVVAHLLEMYGENTYSAKDINILPCEIKYGEVTPEISQMEAELIKSDGIHLDPIYNIKSFFEMTQFVNGHPIFKNVLYINTGGSPNLFNKCLDFVK